MTTEWLRLTTCDRCGAIDQTRHHCGGPDDWPKEYQQLRHENKVIDLCHDCYWSFMAWIDAAKEAERER